MNSPHDHNVAREIRKIPTSASALAMLNFMAEMVTEINRDALNSTIRIRLRNDAQWVGTGTNLREALRDALRQAMA